VIIQSVNQTKFKAPPYFVLSDLAVELPIIRRYTNNHITLTLTSEKVQYMDRLFV